MHQILILIVFIWLIGAFFTVGLSYEGTIINLLREPKYAARKWKIIGWAAYLMIVFLAWPFMLGVILDDRSS